MCANGARLGHGARKVQQIHPLCAMLAPQDAGAELKECRPWRGATSVLRVHFRLLLEPQIQGRARSVQGEVGVQMLGHNPTLNVCSAHLEHSMKKKVLQCRLLVQSAQQDIGELSVELSLMMIALHAEQGPINQRWARRIYRSVSIANQAHTARFQELRNVFLALQAVGPKVSSPLNAAYVQSVSGPSHMEPCTAQIARLAMASVFAWVVHQLVSLWRS